MSITEHEIQVAKDLFNIGWSSDDPFGPTYYMTPDVVMRDIASRPEAIVGTQAIVDRWKHNAGKMRLPVEEVFVSGDGVMVQWFVYVLRSSGEHEGHWATGEGVSLLHFRDGLVSHEVDYWHGIQGYCADWEAHFAARTALGNPARSAVSGFWNPETL